MYNECRHIFTCGKKCKRAALANHDFCFYHANTRKRHKPGTESWHLTQSDYALQLPVLDDPHAIQLAISDITLALAANLLDYRRARTLIYALQVASQNLRAIEQATAAQPTQEQNGNKPEPIPDLESVRKTFPQPDGTSLGPEVQSPDPEDIPEKEDEMTLGRLLLMQYIKAGHVDPETVQAHTEEWCAFKRWLKETGKLEEQKEPEPKPEALPTIQAAAAELPVPRNLPAMNHLRPTQGEVVQTSCQTKMHKRYLGHDSGHGLASERRNGRDGQI
jgi:hypothetical protein